MNRLIKRITALALSISSIFTIATSSVAAATNDSAVGAGQTSIVLKQEEELKYSSSFGWTAVKMTADNKMVYCLQPDKPAPPNGTYRTDKNTLYEYTSDKLNYNLIRKAMYYCYGGDGFKKEVNAFATDTSSHYKEFDGNTMAAFMGNLKYSQYGYTVLEPSGSELHYLLTHILLSYLFGYENWNSKLPSTDWESTIRELTDVIKNAPAVPVSSKLYILDIGSDYQKVIVLRDSIKLQLNKISANASLTANNSCYSLEGARFNIYLNKACTDYFGYIETNKNGYGKYGAGSNGIDVSLQSYYAKEVEAPKGYKLNPTVFEFRDSGQTADGAKIYSFTCADEPGNDPIGVSIKKLDKVTGLSTEKLAGAEFTIKYYDGYYNTADDLISKTPVRSWVVKTDDNGRAKLLPAYLVSGDDFGFMSILWTQKVKQILCK
ncbi:MAG: prealbumin-like fold domain-containing protein, partial [Ruminococcus sp.]|nr:prealbumin-like fold domain-containing protein [Ruminococcus sp.]